MKRFLSLIVSLIIFSLSIKTVEATNSFNFATTDCSGQGGEDRVGYSENACDNVVYTTATVYGWDGKGHAAIHIKAEPADTINISVQTPIFIEDNNYMAIAWSTTYLNWDGFIGGAWFGCNGTWGCPSLSQVPPDNQNGFSGSTTFSESSDYYLAAIAHCGSVPSGCYANIIINCSSCSIEGYSDPTPPESPVTKTVFTPGLGASWSLNDFISCTTSSNQNDWSLAPYAKSVYTGILEALSSADWITLPFYYDWRQNVSDNSLLLSNFIDSNTSDDEKVNFVGHSMGGLVGRGYMESSSGGKLAKYYSVGTPHQGSALSYAPWEGGEVWTDNLIEKIGIDLYLQHCGGFSSNNRVTIQSIFPSIQNLLPTLPYLRDRQTGNLKEISSMIFKNNFITENFIAPFWNVKVGTLSGDGQKTLGVIDVVNPGRNESRSGNWVDGVPVGKEYTNEGDGTVLKSSSQLAGAFQNDVITQTHRGLIGSTEGINSILSFLGSPGIEDPPYSDDTSALVLVGYPGSFQITDEKGAVIKSENGMIVVMNPSDSSYQLQFDPNSSKTTLIIDQFLSNGQSSYKEYSYRTAPNDVKIIEFDSKHISKNPIHEVKEYKKPHFPIFWHGFWKWWIKNRR